MASPDKPVGISTPFTNQAVESHVEALERPGGLRTKPGKDHRNAIPVGSIFFPEIPEEPFLLETLQVFDR